MAVFSRLIFEVRANYLFTFQEGKRIVYRLGEFIRKRYDEFLGNIYLNNSIDGMSSDSNRTKQCLQIVMSAIYPPKGNETWHEKYFEPIDRDKLFTTIYCPE